MTTPLRDYPTFGRVATWDEWRDAMSTSLHDYMLPWFISNMIGLVLLWISIKAPRGARKVWGFLMILASFANTLVVMTDPNNYHEYGVLSIPPYQHIIYSKVFANPALLVFPIAMCQNIIGFVLMLSNDETTTPAATWRLKAAMTGLMIFFFGIAPLGIGSAFPATLIYATTMMLCWPSSSSTTTQNGVKHKKVP
jgi:hypothetical protein